MRVDQRDAAAGDDALFDRRAGRAQRVLDAVLLLLQLGLGGRADLDHRHAAGQLGQPLLQLLAVEVGGRRLDLGLDLLDAALDRRPDRRAPSMIVVSSLVETTRRARPRSCDASTLSSLRPSSSEMTWPPVRMAMSRSISLRRSPKPGALTASTLSVPRSLLTTSVASASPSTSSAMITSGLPVLERPSPAPAGCPAIAEIFLSVIRMNGLVELGLHPLGVGDEVGRDVAAVELHALGVLGLELEALGLLDGDDAVLADLLHHLGDQVADLRVGGGDGGDLGDLVLALDRGRHAP